MPAVRRARSTPGDPGAPDPPTGALNLPHDLACISQRRDGRSPLVARLPASPPCICVARSARVVGDCALG